MANTPTPHIGCHPGDFARTVLMPGDPLRAKFIADTYLTDAKLVNNVRGVHGYTGTWQGKRVSVMASGMGMPSMAIYATELFRDYDVENIIRIGSAGAYTQELHLFDLVLADSCWSESTFALAQAGQEGNIQYPSQDLNETIKQAAAKLNIPVLEKRIHSSDVFYHEDNVPDHNDFYQEQGCVCVEMESYALFHNAKILGKNAACLLTISDSLVTDEHASAMERQTSFSQMMEVALEAAIMR